MKKISFLFFLMIQLVSSFVLKSQCSANFVFSQGLNGLETFTSTSTGTNLSTMYFWDFGEPISGFNTSSLMNPSHIYGSNGIYSVTLAIANGTAGCTSTVVQNVTITSSPCNLPINANWTSTVSGASASFVSISTGTTGSATYSWSFGDGTGSNSPNSTHNYTMSNFYNVKLKVVDGGCVDSLSLNNLNLCFLQPSFISYQGINGIQNFTSTSTGTLGLGVPSWNYGDGAIGSGPLSSHQYTSNGNFNVFLSYPTVCPNYTAFSVVTVTNCYGIGGFLYKDMNSNCNKDISDVSLMNIPVKLYNNSGSLIAQYHSNQSTSYFLNAPPGNYSVRVDTSFLPLVPQCPVPGIDSTNLVLTLGSPQMQNVNFNFSCSGFDVGCYGLSNLGFVFPGVSHTMRSVVGSSIFGNLNCSQGVGGQVILSISGPVTFDNVIPGSLTPTISGNSYTFNVVDFGSLSYNSFGLSLLTNTNATIGNQICVGVTVTPSVNGDVNLNNNTATFCYSVGNSYDPNQKEVYPMDVPVGFQDWLNYSVHFQNLGNAPAMNIRILDTLDNNLDLETFHVVYNSHPYYLTLDGNVANFIFPNIMLPDSTSNPIGSQGLVKYKVKPKPGLLVGTQVKNRAHIYFDFNPAVTTNQTINNYILDTQIGVNKSSFIEKESLSIYPNPSNGKLNLLFANLSNMEGQNCIEVIDAMGNIVYNEVADFAKGSVSKSLNLNHLTNGIYTVKLATSRGSFVSKLIIRK